MSYLTQTRIAADPVMILRAAACAAGEGIPDPRFWAQEAMIHLATTPGWDTAYADSTSEDPGADETAITDDMITGAVQARRAAGAASDPAE